MAESILISTGEDGSYLLRDSATNIGEFTLSVRYVLLAHEGREEGRGEWLRILNHNYN